MGTPNYPKDMGSEWQKLRREVKQVFSSANKAPGAESITQKVVSVLNGLIVKAGAYIQALYQNGSEAFYIGRQTVSGNPVEGVVIRRPNGSLIFWAYGNTSGDAFWSFWDKEGNIIFSDDANSNHGLARPWLSYNVARTANYTTPPQLSTSTSFETKGETISGVMQHPRIFIEAYVSAFGSDVGQVRLVDTTSGATLYTSPNTANNWVTIDVEHPNFIFGGGFRYDLHVRRVSGTSTGVGVTVSSAYGKQS